MKAEMKNEINKLRKSKEDNKRNEKKRIVTKRNG